MTNYILNQDGLVKAHAEGKRFIARVEHPQGNAFNFGDLICDDIGHAADVSLNALKKHDAVSVAVHRILPNGKLNFVRFYDFLDLEERA